MKCPNCGSEKPMEKGVDFIPESGLRSMTISGYTYNEKELEVRDGIWGKNIPYWKCVDCGVIWSTAGAPWFGQMEDIR